MKRILIGAALVGGLLAGSVAIAAPAQGTQDEDLHCPAGGVKVNVNDDNDSESDDQDVVNALVLDEGTRVCVKAGPGNTGIVIADGDDTLQEILFDNGIKDGSGEQGRDVSYYVVYPPLLEAYVCFNGQIVVLTNEVQAALNLAVTAYLAANPGAVQVASREATCVVTTTTTIPPTTTTTVPPTTTTTAPPVTTTTVPPVVTTTVPPAPVSAPLPPEAPHDVCIVNGAQVKVAPGTCPPATLPHTGSNSWLLWVGLALLVSGAASWGMGMYLRGRSMPDLDENVTL